MSQKRYTKNKKRQSNKPKLSKFQKRQERIRNKIINDALAPIRTNLLSSLDKSTLEALQNAESHHNKTSRPTAV